MMTMDERVEAATAAIRKFLGDAVLSPTAEYIARIALQAGVPELTGDKPTHWLAPMEATGAMLDAGSDGVNSAFSLEPGEGFDENPAGPAWTAMRDAYLGKGDGG